MRTMKLILVVATTILPATILPATMWAGVIINEVFYNAPNDLEDLQWIEFYNNGDAPVDLSDWTLDAGKIFTFPKSTTIGARDYVVVALDPKRFAESYGGQAIGPLKRALGRGGERIELADAAGRRIDLVRYKDDDPWPVSPDGYTASLERVCPSVPGDVPENWAASPLSSVDTKPNGTPGKQNASHSTALPPVIKIKSPVPDGLAPDQALRVEAEVSGDGLREVNLLYRVVNAGVEGKESTLRMSRDAVTGRFSAAVPGQKSGSLVRYRLQAVATNGTDRFLPADNDLRPTFSVYVHGKWNEAKVPIGLILRSEADRKKAESDRDDNPPRRGFGRFSGRGPRPNFAGFRRGSVREPRPPRGTSTFVYVSADTGKTMVLDHINIIARGSDRGFRMFFHKDRPLEDMRSLNMIFEGSEWSLLAEPLAYDLYRRAGVPAPLTKFVRLWVDGRMVGYHLAVERINKSFLRRNEIYEDGSLYKIRWMGRDIVGKHEKRTNKHQGHDDLLSIIDKLEKSSGDEQWKVIQENFNVNQVASYFAVNMVLSHWDGFFNNYFPYHDRKNGKWEMYPWDQDKTWGYYDGLPDDQVFFDMPLTFGMEGDRPPGRGSNSRRGFRRGPRWWRPGGDFSRPLLANPQFRKVFLDRTQEILETIYTEEVYFPFMESMAKGIEEEVKLRAAASGREVENAMKELERNVGLLKTHLVKRRQFLLEQLESTKDTKAGSDVQAQPDMDKLLEKLTFTKGTASLPYRLLKPNGYAQDGTNRYPLVIFLHGIGERGTDNKRQLRNGVKEFVKDSTRKKYPCFLVVPQCPPDSLWCEVTPAGTRRNLPLAQSPTAPAALVLELVGAMCKEYRVDTDRIYLTGLSQGGYGTWDLIARKPALFAAAVPVCGGGDPAQAEKLADLPIWAFHGDEDRLVPVGRSRDMIAAIKKAGGEAKYTEYKGVGHESWTPTYKNPELLEWLFKQKKAP